MKTMLMLLVVTMSIAAMAKPAAKLDLNSAINQESQRQVATYKTLSDRMDEKTSTIEEKSKSDANKIVITGGGYQIFEMEEKKPMLKQPKRKQLRNTEKLEEDDFARLESELDSLN